MYRALYIKCIGLLSRSSRERDFICFEQPPPSTQSFPMEVVSRSSPWLCCGWGLGSGRRGLLWRAAESTCSCGPLLSSFSLVALFMGCLMANWCSMDGISFPAWGSYGWQHGFVSTWYNFTVNLVNSVKGKEKRVGPSWNQSKGVLEVIETAMVGWSKFSCLDHLFSHFVYIALVIFGNNLNYTKQQFKI